MQNDIRVTNNNQGVVVGTVSGDFHINKITNQRETEAEKRENVINELANKLKTSYIDLQMSTIPWLETKLSLDEHFIDLWMVKKDPVGKEKLEKKISIEDLINLTQNYQRFILIEGRPGTGKSTLAKKLAQKWSDGDDQLANFDLVFVIYLRQFHNETIKGFLVKEGLLKNKNVSLEYLWDSISMVKCLFIMDGLDEITIPNKSRIIKVITELQQQPNFSVIVTTRSMQLNDLHIGNLLKIILQGFSKDGIDEFLDRYFIEDERIAKKIKAVLVKEKHIAELCQYPLFLVLFTFLIEGNPSDYCLPETETGLFKDVLNFMITRYYTKIGKNMETVKIDLFASSIDKKLKLMEETIFEFAVAALDALKENRLTFTDEEIDESSINCLVKLGILVKNILNTESIIYEPIHKSFLEFLCSFYLFKLFSSSKKEFNESLQKIFYHQEKQDSLILPFLGGLLQKDAKDMIENIPLWFFFGNLSTMISLIQETHELLEDPHCLSQLIPNYLSLDIFIKNEIFILNDSLKKNLSNNLVKSEIPLIEDKCWLGCQIEVLHSTSNNEFTNQFSKAFQKNTFDIININFPCQNLEILDHCNEDCFSESQMITLMEALLKKKPNFIRICFPHCEKSFHSMLQCISKSTVTLNCIFLYGFEFSNEDVDEIASVVLNQNLDELYLFREKNEFRGNLTISINPLIQSMVNPLCQLKKLFLIDIIVDKIQFYQLIEGLAKSQTIDSLIIRYSSESGNTVDLSHLCQFGQKSWKWLDLRNIEITISQEKLIQIDSMFLVKCIFDEETSMKLFTFCQMKYLRSDCKLIQKISLEENIEKYPFYKSMDTFSIEDASISVSPSFLLKLQHMSVLWLDMRTGFVVDKTSEENLTEFLTQTKVLECLHFCLTFDDDNYLKIIDLLVSCFQLSNELNPKSKRTENLLISFGPKFKGLNYSNERILRKNETEAFLVSLSRLRTFISNGFLSKLTVEIQQPRNKGHYFSPFVKINDYFPNENYKIDYLFDSKMIRARWIIECLEH